MPKLPNEFLDLIQEYFDTFDDLDPSYIKLHVGMYYKSPTPYQYRAKKHLPPVACDYYLSYFTDPLHVGGERDDYTDYWNPDEDGSDDELLPTEFKVDRSYEYDSKKFATRRFVAASPTADSVYDNYRELRNCSFPFAEPLSKLATSSRKELYGKHLGKVDARPAGVPRRYNRGFLRALANHCTYTPKGDYYKKWRAGRENKHPLLNNVSPNFFNRVTHEVKLEKNQLYVVITNKYLFDIYQLHYDADRQLYRDAVVGYILAHKYRGIKDRSKIPSTVFFFRSSDGLTSQQYKKHRRRRTYRIAAKQSALISMTDAKALVEETLGKKANKLANLKSDDDWFIELLVTRFPHRFYTFDTSRVRKTWGTDAQQLRTTIHKTIIEDINNAVASGDEGIFSKRTKREIMELLDTPNLVVIPQGFPVTSQSWFVGFDGVYAYEYHQDNGLISRMPWGEWLLEVAVGKNYNRAYQNTKGLLPFMKAVAIIAVLGVGGAVAGAAGLTVHGVRMWAVNRIRSEISTRLLWGLVQKLGPAIAAVVADVVLEIFQHVRPGDKPKLWQAFAKGFFEGYVVQTIFDNFYNNAKKLVLQGPKEYRLLITIKRLYNILDRIHELYGELERELDSAAIQKAVTTFQTATKHLIQGIALLLTAVYYVPHKDAESLLGALASGGPDGRPPTPDQWEAESTAQVAKIAAAINKQIDNLSSIDDLVLSIRNNKLIATGAVVAVLYPQIWSVIKYTWDHRTKKKKPMSRKRKAAFYSIAIAAVALLAGYGKHNNWKLINTIGALIKETVTGFPGRDVKTANLYGKIVGNLLGGFMLDRFLFKDKHPFHKMMNSPIVGATLDNNLKHGVVKGVVAVVFKRYVALYNEFVTRGILSSKRREDEIGRLLGTLRDQELKEKGFGHLTKKMTGYNKARSLQDICLMILGLHRLVREDSRNAVKAEYSDEISRLKQDFKATERLGSAMGLTQFAKEHAGVTYHHMATHLSLALGELAQSVRDLFTPFTSGGKFSWIILLRELGFDLGDIDEIQKQLHETKKKEVAGFNS